MPAMEAAARRASVAVIGISVVSPPRRRMSRVCASWSTMPALMKSGALKVAWLRMWKAQAMAAIGVPKPSSITMRPRWLTVEKASSALRSSLKMAIQAPTSMVMRPAEVTMRNHRSVPARAGHRRASRNTPAFTMVAECR
jgi:hypothetical protein